MTNTIENPRNVRIDGVELNWARLDKPVNPFGTEQYELQIATTDAAKAQEMRDNFLNVKEKDGKFIASLKRKAKKADGTDNGQVRVVDANLTEVADKRSIGNGSVGNVILFQYPYDAMGRKGVASSLTAVQITKHEVYAGSTGVDFEAIGGGSVEQPAGESADLF